MREDTSPETPMAKTNSDPPPKLGEWRRPVDPGEGSRRDEFFGELPGGARFDWAFGTGKVRTFQASGPAAVALAIVVFVVIGALIAMFFAVAVGVGTAVALGAGTAAALGLGVNAVRRRLSGPRHGQLGPGDR